jgi:hypothetical protein
MHISCNWANSLFGDECGDPFEYSSLTLNFMSVQDSAENHFRVNQSALRADRTKDSLSVSKNCGEP